MMTTRLEAAARAYAIRDRLKFWIPCDDRGRVVWGIGIRRAARRLRSLRRALRGMGYL